MKIFFIVALFLFMSLPAYADGLEALADVFIGKIIVSFLYGINILYLVFVSLNIKRAAFSRIIILINSIVVFSTLYGFIKEGQVNGTDVLAAIVFQALFVVNIYLSIKHLSILSLKKE